MLLTSMVLFPEGTASSRSAFSRGRTGNFQRGIEPQTRRSTPLQRHRAHALPAARELTGICMKILRGHIAESLAMKIIPKPHHALKSSFMDETAPLARSSWTARSKAERRTGFSRYTVFGLERAATPCIRSE